MARITARGMLIALAAFWPGDPAGADYRGPIRFDSLIFRNIRPSRFRQPPIRHTPIPRENLRTRTIRQQRIRHEPIRRSSFRQQPFRFDSSIFGHVPDGKLVPEGTGPAPRKAYVPPHLRNPAARRPLGW